MKKLTKKHILQRQKIWQVDVPKWVLSLTKKEIYLHGFDSGYRCGQSDAEKPIAQFKFCEQK